MNHRHRLNLSLSSGRASVLQCKQQRWKWSKAADPSSFEARVLSLCEQMMSQSCWSSGSDLDHSKNSRGMTLLHLAAAQGLHRAHPHAEEMAVRDTTPQTNTLLNSFRIQKVQNIEGNRYNQQRVLFEVMACL
ncbi:hypothetical protein WMY93_033045 [Mugilogobius chulae]|uniref:Uncharacterized protein n=1 Tax=Mugilogobius chulae TaxID=88201 RepID=A0AAW0MP28_9GOBI